ncbi:MAG TPA: hypothetical protein VMG12_17120, partial [Polyangiaceae bacterium]|nr:hypothetical protein [Polyangiaceae bacterium]
APLAVSAPRECPDAAALERAVAAHVGRAVPLDDVSLSIERGRSAWHARLQTADGERELEAESCPAAIDAAALVLALAVEPEAPAPAEAPTASTASTASAAPGAASAARGSALLPGADGSASVVIDAASHANDAASADRDERVGFGLGAGVLGEVGLLPAPSLGVRLAFGVTWWAWRLELAGVALLPRRAELGGDAALVADIAWWAAELSACRRLIGALQGCAGPELGVLHGEGSGVDAPRSAEGTWAAATLGAVWSSAWSTPPGPWSWQVGTSAALAVVRPEFGFDGIGVLHRPSPISGRLWLAVAWR